MKSSGMARLGSDMELRFLPDGTAVGQVSLAVRLGIKDKQYGDYKTQWISASLFGKRAESLAPYLLKGSLHCFHLKDVHLDEFEGKDGEKRASMKAVIEDVEFGSKQAGDNSGAAAAPATSAPKQSLKQPVTGANFDSFDDDIPF